MKKQKLRHAKGLAFVVIQEWIETSDCQVISPSTDCSLFSLLIPQCQEEGTFWKTMYFEERNNAAGKWEKKVKTPQSPLACYFQQILFKIKNKQKNPHSSGITILLT